MNYWSFFLIHIFFFLITTNSGDVPTLDVQQDERIRLECTLTSKSDAEEVNLLLKYIELHFFV
jgi:hypothetical protein